jgi:peptide deformylase
VVTTALLQKVQEFESAIREFPQIRFVGDPVLRQVCTAVTPQEGTAIGRKLRDTLDAYRKKFGFGRGLAAPQIGVAKKVFVAFDGSDLEIFINPTIRKQSAGMNYYREFCLSAGLLAADIRRPEWIILEWTSTDGRQVRKRFDGFGARLIQHEEAHLRGKLNLDEAATGGIEFFLFDPLAERLRKAKSE